MNRHHVACIDSYKTQKRVSKQIDTRSFLLWTNYY